MSLDGLRVDHAALEAAADDLSSAVARIDGRLAMLDQDLQPLRSSWEGSAQQAYLQAKARWDVAIGEMRDLLRLTADRVREADAAYAAADVRGARAFGG
jgi:WXG100 family type VII secretion target